MDNSGSRALLIEVARALGDLLDDVVLIGGTIAPLLQSNRVLGAPRPTGGVDAIVLTASYADFEAFRSQLRSRGFLEKPDGGHAHRWMTPGVHAIPFDLVPVGEHLGASSNPWDRTAIETAVSATIAEGLTIRHPTAAGFLALKLAAFRDRGAADPFASEDLEDIFALIASGGALETELFEAPAEVRQFVSQSLKAVINLETFDDLIAARLGHLARSNSREVIMDTEARMRRIAEQAV